MTDKKEELKKIRKKHLMMFLHEREHKAQQEKMHVAKGGWTDSTLADGEIETLDTSWKDKTQDLRERLRSRKAKAKAMWRGR